MNILGIFFISQFFIDIRAKKVYNTILGKYAFLPPLGGGLENDYEVDLP